MILIGAVNAQDDINETVRSAEHSTDCSGKDILSKVSSQDFRNLSSKKVVNSLIPCKAKIKLSPMKVYFGDNSKFKITLKDTKKNFIKNAKLKIFVADKEYSVKTNDKGVATFLPKFDVGTYKIIVNYDGGKKYQSVSASTTLTIKSTIKESGISKYYVKNTGYRATFLNKDGKALKNSNVKFKINDKSFTVKTNAKGVARLSFDFTPASYTLSLSNPKTSQSIVKTFWVKNIIESRDLIMNESDSSKFSVKVLDKNGEASPNKIVKFTITGRSYSSKSNSQGVAILAINLTAGNYSVTTEFGGIKNINRITVNEVLKVKNYSHRIYIPNYVNVTLPYAFHCSYTLKDGLSGIVKMPKVEVFTIKVNSSVYKFKTDVCDDNEAMFMDFKSYYIPFDDSSLLISFNKKNLPNNGIVITRDYEGVEIDYRDTLDGENELFGIYSKSNDYNEENLVYMKNNILHSEISIKTKYFDETGVKYILSKLYNTSMNDFNYHVYCPSIVFTNTNQSVTYSYTGKSIVGFQSQEHVDTSFTVDNMEKFRKVEEFNYGLNKKSKFNYPFEFLQTFTMIGEEITFDKFKNAIADNTKYTYSMAGGAVYGMYLASLQVALLSNNTNHNFTVFAGVNLDDTFLEVLDNLSYSSCNDSLLLPYIEQYSLLNIVGRYSEGVINPLDNILHDVKNNHANITREGDFITIACENMSMSLDLSDNHLKILCDNNGFSYGGVRLLSDSNCYLLKITLPYTIQYFINEFDYIGELEKLIINKSPQINNLISLIK